MSKPIKPKIVATIGPASDKESILEEMVKNGVCAVRINFSHSSHSNIQRRFSLAKRTLEKYFRRYLLFGDIQGPKIRLGFLKRKFFVKDNTLLKLSATKPTKDTLLVDYPYFHRYLKRYDKIFLDDGRIELFVEDVRDEVVICRVITGGWISSRKGVTLVNKILPLPTLGEKDLSDIKFALSIGMKAFALSFVRKKEDVLELRKLLLSIEKGKYFIISKIEDRVGFENIDEIIKVSDGIMIARGDLGVSVDRSLVPLIQKEIIDKCNLNDIPEIVATQMLESMTVNPYPTRAEVNDVAVAVMQGADYLMLSGETALGKYPIKVVKEMKSIIDSVVSYMKFHRIFR